MIGSGRYSVGIVMGPTGASLAIVEKRPRPLTLPREDEEYEDFLAVIWHDHFTGGLTDVAGKLAAHLQMKDLRDDASAYVDVGELGLPARRLLTDRGAYATPLIIAKDEETSDDRGIVSVPLRTIQSRVTVAMESDRFGILEGLPNAAEILRGLESLETLPAVGPTRDRTMAAAIAIWAADKHATHGPWASRRAPPRGSPEWYRLREIDELQADVAKARRRAEADWFDLEPDELPGAGEW
jgi:hypothetical protein